MENQKSALGLDGNITALLGYIIGIIAIISIVIEKDNKFVRFHAFQSILLFVAYIVAIIALVIVGVVAAFIGAASSSLATIVGLLVTLLWLGVFFGFIGALILSAIKAFQGNWFKLPVIGNMAEKWANG